MSFNLKDILHPFTVWKNLTREPVTVKDPLNDRPGAANYRGFHKNDLEKCIGCGTCEEICQNGAIDMVPVEGVETKEGDSGLRPKIDYGRCCWCALCVDICATCSLTMSNSYTWVSDDPEDFRFIPGTGDKPWYGSEEGYTKAADFQLNPPDRVKMEELSPGERDKSFIEIVKGYSKEQALEEAERCVACGLCTASCPAHMGIPEYIKAIREDDMEKGLRVLYQCNPLPEICGRICTHKCETVCALQHKGEAVSIRWLKRYIADQVPAEKYKEILGTDKLEWNGKKVAIVGAGPAGLATAHYLALLGYRCNIFEALPEAGGMMRYGIPEYRLPYPALDKDIDYIKSLGVEIQTGMHVDRDITLEELKTNYDAVYISTGLHSGRSTGVPGTDHRHVFQAIELLREVTKGGEIHVAESIVVIGGGNVAMDIGRTLARLQKRAFGKINIIITSLETEDIMPADREEIVEAREEGIEIRPGWGPREIVIEDGKIRGLEVVRCVSVFDELGRFSPKFADEDSEFFKGAMVVEAIGQGMDLSYIPESMSNDLQRDGRGRLEVSNDFQTSLSWLFVGGDIIEGPDVIHAIANGHRAAIGIDKYLSTAV